MKIIIAGDFCPQNRVAKLFDNDNFSDVLGEVKPIIKEADYSIVNFECAVTHGVEKPIKKIGPNLQCTEKGIEAIKWAGFDCVTLANNHFYDYGDDGVANTLNACLDLGIDFVGGGINLSEASKTIYREINGQTLAIINCCEHEFSIATENTGGCNPLNPIRQFYAIREARNNADYVLIVIHGGHEMWQLPSPRMVETYRFFIDSGADIVVNHHQHCFSGYEFYQGKPIVYGLGNFCFDKLAYYSGLWDFGYMLKVQLESSIKIDVIPYQQCGKEPKVELLRNMDLFSSKLDYLNEIIASSTILQSETDGYYSKNRKAILMNFEPYFGKILYKLYLKKWLPSFMTKRRIMQLQNILLCESHRDKVLNALSH